MHNWLKYIFLVGILCPLKADLIDTVYWLETKVFVDHYGDNEVRQLYYRGTYQEHSLIKTVALEQASVVSRLLDNSKEPGQQLFRESLIRSLHETLERSNPRKWYRIQWSKNKILQLLNEYREELLYEESDYEGE